MPRPDPHSGAAPSGAAVQRRRLLPGPYLGWTLVGSLWGFSIAGILSIGLFIMPVALAVTVVMCLGYTRPDGWPGALGGIGLVGLYLGLANRGASANPWPFLIAGIALIAVCALVSWRWYTRPIRPRHWRSRA